MYGSHTVWCSLIAITNDLYDKHMTSCFAYVGLAQAHLTILSTSISNARGFDVVVSSRVLC